MSDLYDKAKNDMQFRKEVAERAGLGFELPSEKSVVGPNGPKIENEVVLEMCAPGGTRTPDPLLRRYIVQNSKCPCWCRLRGSASLISPLNWTEDGLNLRVLGN
jgi:hypothetical protein